MNIDIKSFECDCKCIFTAPKEINTIYAEFAELGIPYKEARVEENGKYIVLYCPDCDKEIYRVRL